LSTPSILAMSRVVNLVSAVKQIEAQFVVSNAPLLPRDHYDSNAEE
jgi:hypothetical protein